MNDTFKIIGLDHIVLNTQNMDDMIYFYCQILGCPIEKVQPELGLTQLRAGDSIIDLITADATTPLHSSLNHFCLRIHPFDYDHLQQYFNSKKIEILRYGQRYGAQGYGFSFYLKDPDGNEVELKEAAAKPL